MMVARSLPANRICMLSICSGLANTQPTHAPARDVAQASVQSVKYDEDHKHSHSHDHEHDHGHTHTHTHASQGEVQDASQTSSVVNDSELPVVVESGVNRMNSLAKKFSALAATGEQKPTNAMSMTSSSSSSFNRRVITSTSGRRQQQQPPPLLSIEREPGSLCNAKTPSKKEQLAALEF